MEHDDQFQEEEDYREDEGDFQPGTVLSLGRNAWENTTVSTWKQTALLHPARGPTVLNIVVYFRLAIILWLGLNGYLERNG